MTKNKKESKIKNALNIFGITLKNNLLFTSIIAGCFLLLVLLNYISFDELGGFSKLNLDEFEIGKVSNRDIISNRDIEYVDIEATEKRREEKKRSVCAVFIKDVSTADSILRDYNSFTSVLNDSKTDAKNFDSFKAAVQEKYKISDTGLKKLYEAPKLYQQEPYQIISTSGEILKQILDAGFAELSVSALAAYNPSEIIVLTKTGNKQLFNSVSFDSLVTQESLTVYIKMFLRKYKKADYSEIVEEFIKAFIKPNLSYDYAETLKRTEDALKQVPPVKLAIHKNQKIIRQGFQITEERYNQLKILKESGGFIDTRQFAGAVLFLFTCVIISFFLFSERILSVTLAFNYRVLIVIAFMCVYILLLFLPKSAVFAAPLDFSPVLPVAFFTMLIAALTSEKVSVFTVFILSLGIMGASNFRTPLALYALFSGMTGASAIRITGKRMDLIKTACILAAIHPIIIIGLVGIFPGAASNKILVLLAASLNGFLSGIFVLGFLPILETILNTPTSFRLIELSDLNSPMMKKMLVTVSGTYNHSIMVAALAENACRAIGANPLLARVGAYYHDIGKMDNAEYFVENQRGGYNRHDDINPRLSAAIIRSHVKLGIEKARQLRLPQEVIDIVAEHHGNGLIAYFYAKAKEENPDVDPKDFSYPGTPPRTKESAVVMLADVVEAACRAMKSHSVPNLTKRINELVKGKIEHGQLDNSDLTFRDITIIKDTFVSILAGYYHSRIEYPNQKNTVQEKQTENDPAQHNAGGNNDKSKSKNETESSETETKQNIEAKHSVN